MANTQQLLSNYANAAADLAESIKSNIQHGGVVTDDTVLALNEFIIAANAVADLIQVLDNKRVTLN